jgi:hypothetical protein
MNRWFWPGLYIVLTATSLGVVAWTLAGVVDGPLGFAPKASTGVPAPQMVDLLGNAPIVTQPIPVRVGVACDPADLARCSAWIAGPVKDEDEPTARSRVLHAARLPIAPTNISGWLERDELDFKRVTRVKLVKRGFWHTWRGFEMAEKDDGKSTEHRDQTLAALAESGVGLNAPLEAENGTFEVRDLLRTSLNEFHLGQEEISWTASAYIAYLPPQTTWQNRYGERFSFDRLVEEIMQRSLAKESCGGTHLVMALTKAARVDQDVMTILDPKVRERLVGYLRGKVSEAVGSQLEDGSWPHCWSPSGSVPPEFEYTPEPTDKARVTITGHLLEWFHLLPEGLKPSAGTVKAGTVWIRSKLRSATKESVTEDFCPYTHAVVSLYFATSDPTR